MKSLAFLRFATLLLGTVACVALLSASVTQEVPRGGIRIVVTMKENHKPLPKAWVSLSRKDFAEEVEVPAQSVTGEELQPRHEYRYDYHRYRTDKNGEIVVPSLPAGLYTVGVDARAHSAHNQLISIDEATTKQISLELEPNEPYLELYSSQRVFTPGEKASFEIRGFDPADGATIHYYKLDLGKIAAKQGLGSLLRSFSRPGNEDGDDPSNSATKSEQFEKRFTSKDIEGVFTEPVTMPDIDEGFYYVTCKVGKQSRSTYLNISTIGVVTKTSGSDALCYVADLVSGEPVAGASIEESAGAGFRRVAKTDRSGIARITLVHVPDKRPIILASFGKSKAVVDIDNETGGGDRKARIFMYSDRPIYRPGDTIQFKGIVRKLEGLNYSLPGAGEIEVEVRDSGETVVKNLRLPISARGGFHGDFTTNTEDKPGDYSIKATYGGATFTYYASLAAYRKPEFSIKVTPNKEFFIYGDRASATLKAEYYFGGPVVGAKVEAYVTRRAHYSYLDEEGDESYYGDEGDSGGDYGGGSLYSREFQGEYNEKVEVQTNEKGEAVIEFKTKSEDDPNEPDYDLDYSVFASITDESGKYFEGTGDVAVVRGDVSVNLTTDQYIAAPGDTIAAKVTVRRHSDESPVARRTVTLEVGTEEWDSNTSTFKPARTLTGITDSKGVATIPVRVSDEGSLVLKATVLDSAGRRVKAADYIYLEGDHTNGPPEVKFKVTLDKKTYHVGDTCKVLIESDKPGGAALVTVQAEKVMSTYVVRLPKRSSIIKLSVLHDYAPNVWVSAVGVRNKKLSEAQGRLVVDLKEHDLKVTVSPDKPDYQPGDTANLTIKTTDSDGRPVPADLSVGVVDESIYAIQEDSTNIKKAFYPQRTDRVTTNYSFSEIYLDGGDKAGRDIPVRTKFLDTASWQPNVQTDAMGIGHTSVELPGNLTSWRATAVGVSDATQVGMAKVNFRARKPLMVRLELPSFLVQQDTQRVTAIVTNDTGKDQQVNVRFDAEGVQMTGPTLQKVSVSATRPLALTWEIQSSGTGSAKLATRVWVDGGAQDGVQLTLPVEAHGRHLVEAHSGEIGDATAVDFRLSKSADKNSGRLLLSISPSIGTSIYQSLDELIDFPYGCTEQTMSRFLPTVVLSSTLKELGLRSDLQARIPEIVATGFSRLAKMQHSNGAWGWWENDEADLYMTAYVLDGLKRAREAGFESNKIDEKRALEWAKKQMKDRKLLEWDSRDFLYLSYAVASRGGKDEARQGLARVHPKGASEFALLALIYRELGDSQASGEALAKLHDLIKTDGDIAYFKSELWDYGAESMAFPLLALMAAVPQDTTIPKLVRYLMANRRGSMWNSTRDSSLALIALTQYMRFTRDTGKAVDIEVLLNGESRRKMHFDPADLFNSALKVTIPISALKPGVNRLSFHKVGGEGLCYFTADLRQVELADHLLPMAGTGGLTVARNYYLLRPQAMENGQLELRPTKASVDQAKAGDLVRVELTVTSDQDRQFVMIEDPIPSSCRITERTYIDTEDWNYWWSQTIVRDDRAAFFMRYLEKGVHKLTYTMRAEQIGTSHALPTAVSNMYDPSQSANGGENLLKVTE